MLDGKIDGFNAGGDGIIDGSSDGKDDGLFDSSTDGILDGKFDGFNDESDANGLRDAKSEGL